MAMNIHQEARRKQMFMDKVVDARRRMCADGGEAKQASGVLDTNTVPEQLRCTDQGQFYQTRSILAWTGPERNRRFYDRSREGPIMGQSRRELNREMNFRERSLSSVMYQSKAPAPGFQPIDAAFARR